LIAKVLRWDTFDRWFPSGTIDCDLLTSRTAQKREALLRFIGAGMVAEDERFTHAKHASLLG
jgi:hypothetical protein